MDVTKEQVIFARTKQFRAILLSVVFAVLGGQQHATTLCSPMVSSPDLTCMDKPAVHSFRSYGGTSCVSLPVLPNSVFGTVSAKQFAVVNIFIFIS